MNRNTTKYNKVTQQQKFHLLTLVLKDKLLIKEAAKLIDINYSTAKTILFFYRNHAKGYQFNFTQKRTYASVSRAEAIVSELPPHQPDTNESSESRFMTIDVISTIGVCANDLGNSYEEDESYSFFDGSLYQEKPLRNYPLTHNNLHAQQKGVTEDVLTQCICKRVTRSQAGLAPTSSKTLASEDNQASSEGKCKQQSSDFE